MILVAGATGRLGTQIVSLLLGRRQQVRVLTRDPQRAQHLRGEGLEIATGDVRDPDSLPGPMAGVDTVVSAVHGFEGPGGVTPASVDHLGNRNLIAAAEAAGARRFVMLSVVGAAPDHVMELFRMKHRAEQLLRGSSLDWTIIRATAFMELWAALVGAPILKDGKTTIFGRGENPINFVSVLDVARFVDLAVSDPGLRGAVIEVGGPENLTFNQVAAILARAAGKEISVSHVPLPVMRLASVVMRPLKPALARQIQAGVVMDTSDMRLDAQRARQQYPSIPFTSLAEAASQFGRPLA